MGHTQFVEFCVTYNQIHTVCGGPVSSVLHIIRYTQFVEDLLAVEAVTHALHGIASRGGGQTTHSKTTTKEWKLQKVKDRQQENRKKESK